MPVKRNSVIWSWVGITIRGPLGSVGSIVGIILWEERAVLLSGPAVTVRGDLGSASTGTEVSSSDVYQLLPIDMLQGIHSLNAPPIPTTHFLTQATSSLKVFRSKLREPILNPDTPSPIFLRTTWTLPTSSTNAKQKPYRRIALLTTGYFSGNFSFSDMT
nr:hypothetical protein L204_01326 [Cryptococcus depauperatus CBS 7855]